MRKKGPPKEEKTKVPAYIVTFSDMITLLLTFFVLLLSMASEQVDETKFERSREALVAAFSNMGIRGISTSKTKSLNVGYEASLNPVDKDELLTEVEALDASEEVIRQIFQEIEKEMHITPAQITGKSPDFRPTGIKFKRGRSVLNKAAEKYLEDFSFDLKQNVQNQSLTMYVVGLAPKERTLQRQCLISAKRAQATADFLRKSLPKGNQWKIHSWGAGPGGQWKSNGPVAESQIVIAVLGG